MQLIVGFLSIVASMLLVCLLKVLEEERRSLLQEKKDLEIGLQVSDDKILLYLKFTIKMFKFLSCKIVKRR